MSTINIQIPINLYSAPIVSLVAGTGLAITAGPNPTISIAPTGVTANTYAFPTSVTVLSTGQVSAITAGSQPVTTITAGTGINVTGSAPGPTISSTALSAAGIFGDGSDGNVTISAGTTTLTRDMYYNNLVVNGNINAAGARIFVKGTLSGTGGIISNNGGNASGTVQGSAAGSITLGGGYIGGPGGPINSNGGGGDTPNPSQWVGGNGGNGGSAVGGGSNNASTRPQTTQGGRTLTGSGLSSGTLFPFWCNPYAGLTGRDIDGALMGGGIGGAGGGGSASAAGGGGGGSGGILACFINANTSSNVTFQARGGNGAPATGTNAAGGGGGGGGYVYLVYNSANWAPTGFAADANPGNGAAGNGTGTAGSNGTAGGVHIIAL